MCLRGPGSSSWGTALRNSCRHLAYTLLLGVPPLPVPFMITKQTHEKMLNITHYQRNANQNHNEVPLHASQDGCYPKVYKQ